jgi:hypothetical protein
MLTENRNDEGSTIPLLLAIGMLAVMVFVAGITPARADDPTGGVTPQSQYRVALDSQYRGGSVKPYGKAYALAVTSAPGTAYMTGASADGLNKIDFYNSGSGTVLCSLNGTQVSTANCQVYLPSGTAYTSVTKAKVCTMSYYCPTGTATLVVSE